MIYAPNRTAASARIAESSIVIDPPLAVPGLRSPDNRYRTGCTRRNINLQDVSDGSLCVTATSLRALRLKAVPP